MGTDWQASAAGFAGRILKGGADRDGGSSFGVEVADNAMVRETAP